MFRRSAFIIFFCVISAISLLPTVHAAIPLITVRGATANIDFKSVIDRISSSPSQEDLRRLATEITNLYHENGYTTSYAEKVLVKKNGDIEILVRESKIVEISVFGVDDERARKIGKILLPQGHELYNRITIKERADYAAQSLKLSSIKIEVLNIENSADVALKIEANVSKIGSTRIAMKYEPIYGFSPMFSYNQKCDSAAISIAGMFGIRDDAWRKKYTEAMISRPVGDVFGLYTKYEWSSSLETWDELNKDFSSLSHRPSLGMRYAITRNILFDISSILDFFTLENYLDSQSSFHDVALRFMGRYSDAEDIMVPGEETNLQMALLITRSGLEKKNIFSANFFFDTHYTPVAWMNIRPALAGNYTTADERYYRLYVYDETFPVRNNDFSATHAKISGHLYFEYEAYPEMLNFGPIIYQTWYYNEISFDTQSETALGICSRIIIGRFYINALCVWPTDSLRENPVFLFSANGVF